MCSRDRHLCSRFLPPAHVVSRVSRVGLDSQKVPDALGMKRRRILCHCREMSLSSCALLKLREFAVGIVIVVRGRPCHSACLDVVQGRTVFHNCPRASKLRQLLRRYQPLASKDGGHQRNCQGKDTADSSQSTKGQTGRRRSWRLTTRPEPQSTWHAH